MRLEASALSNMVTGSELVQVARRLRASAITTGLLVGVSDSLLLVNKLSDDISLDGFVILRLRDVTSVVADFRRKPFYSKGLSLKGIEAQPLPPLDIVDLPAAVASVSNTYPLLVIARERVHPGEISIGRVTELSRTGVRMQLIDPSAEPHEGTEFYRFNTVTSIEFGGEYERTLALVAGITSGSS
jgi:hypothetical protein